MDLVIVGVVCLAVGACAHAWIARQWGGGVKKVEWAVQSEAKNL